jgi:sialic acid synthase SpsE
MARMLPALAVSMGAEVIEKHITDDRTRKGRDHYSALNPEEFISFVRLLRSLPNIIGEEQEWSLSDAEMKYRKFTKRQAVAAREIAVGTKLDLKDIVFKRTNEVGLSSQDLAEYTGREFTRSKNNDDPLTPEDFFGS